MSPSFTSDSVLFSLGPQISNRVISDLTAIR